MIHCPKCATPADVNLFNTLDLVRCPACRSRLQIAVFPAFFKPRTGGAAAEAVVDENEASCYNHPQKRAAVVCDSCGRFVCALCDLELKGQHMCPECLEKGVKKKKITDLETRRFLYDTLSLQLAFGPIIIPIFFFVTCITAPAALFVTIRYWKQPLGLLRRSRWRFIVAATAAVVQIGLWGYVVLTFWFPAESPVTVTTFE